MSKTINVGPVTAYAIAVKHGFTGTEAEWIASIGGDLSNYYTKGEVDEAIRDQIPNRLPNPYPLTINGQEYSGTEAVTITISGGDGTNTTGQEAGKIIHVNDAVPATVKSLYLYDANGDEVTAEIAIANKNFFRIDLLGASTTSKGITFRKNEDGSIRATGTSTDTYAAASVELDKNIFVVGRTYTISTGKTEGSLCVQLMMKYSDGTTDYLVSRNSNTTFTVAKTVTSCTASVQITDKGVTLDEIIYPQVEMNPTATAFEMNTYTSLVYSGSNLPALPAKVSNLWSNDDTVSNILMAYEADKLTYLQEQVDDLNDTVDANQSALDAKIDANKSNADSRMDTLAEKSSAISNITRSGTTFTATRADGTSFTFNQQDNNTTYSAATQSAQGLMSAADKTKLDGVEAGAQKNTVIGIKGNSESTYRTGNVNLTAANVGAAATGHKHDASDITSGTLPVARGGTGKTTENAAANSFINALEEGTFPATAEDYIVAQYAAGGTATTTYHRRKLSNVFKALSKSDVTTALGYTPPTSDTNTTYTLTQDSSDGHKLTFKPSNGSATTITIPDNNTTYAAATQSANGLMSAADKKKLDGVAASANNYTHPTSSGNKHIPAGGSSGQILRWSADGTAAWGADNDTIYTHPTYTAKSSGLYKVTVDGTGHVSATAAVTKADITALGIPAQDTNTTYSAMKGATASANGTTGLVPAPASGKQTSFLRGDGTWVVPTNTTYSAATQSAQGLMSAADKTKLDGIASGAQVNSITGVKGNSESSYRTGNVNITAANIGLGNVENKSSATIRGEITKANVTTALGYTPPTTNTTYSNMGGATSSAAGSAGLVPAPAAGKQTSFLRGDGTWVVPTNTTYSNATTSSAGLMSSTDKTKLDGIASGANAYSLPAATSSALGGVKIGSNITNSSGTISLTKANVTSALGYTPPTTNTTYSNATTSTAGLMSATDKSIVDKLNTSRSSFTSIGNSSTLSNPTGLKAIKIGKAVVVSSEGLNFKSSLGTNKSVVLASLDNYSDLIPAISRGGLHPTPILLRRITTSSETVKVLGYVYVELDLDEFYLTFNNTSGESLSSIGAFELWYWAD